MRVVVAYDIVDSPRRTKVSRTLEGYAERVQRSVFEGDMSQRQFQQMRLKVSRIKLGPEDSIRYYVICAGCEKKVIIEGKGDLVRAPKHFIV